MAVSKIAEEVMNYKYPPFLFLYLTPCMHARVAISVFLFKEIQILSCRDGNGEEREGTNIPVPILNVLRMSPFPLCSRQNCLSGSSSSFLIITGDP